MQNKYFKTVELFGKQVDIKSHLCSRNKDDFYPCDPKIALYIKITDSCNASCEFCSNRNIRDNGKLDMNKLEYVTRHLLDNGYLHSINITGGEPMLEFESLNEVINLIISIDPSIKISFNTNGINFEKILDLDEIDKIYNIHLSRHHYDDKVNNSIFGFDTIGSDKLSEIQKELCNKKLLVVNCLLMKKYINSKKEVKRMLDSVAEADISKVGFVSLMPFNDFARDNFISFRDIFNELDEDFLFTNGYYNREYCECQDGIYLANNGKLMEFYGRMTNTKSCDYALQLVYTSDNRVTTGFNKPTLY